MNNPPVRLGFFLRFLIWTWLVLLLAAAFLGERLMFLPQAPTYDRGPDYLELTSTNGKRVMARHLVATKADLTILYCHGNAEDLGDSEPALQNLQNMGVSVLAVDYPGYGQSDGTPSERGAIAAVEAGYRHLVRDRGLDPGRIIVYGRSVGGGPAVDLASRLPVGGLILESAFASALRVKTPIRFLPIDRFDNLAKIGRVRCPLLIMHGTADQVIPFWHAQAVFQAASEPKSLLTIPGGHHNDLGLVADREISAAIKGFCARQLIFRQ